jgi:hypothetical protein
LVLGRLNLLKGAVLAWRFALFCLPQILDFIYLQIAENRAYRYLIKLDAPLKGGVNNQCLSKISVRIAISSNGGFGI